MVPVLLIGIPLLAGLIGFSLKDVAAKSWALFASLLTLGVSLVGICLPKDSRQLLFNEPWMGSLNSHFAISLDGTGQILCLLTAIAFPLIFISTWKEEYKKAHNFFGLMLLSQAGLLGVFLATDALLFYFFWELALIPVYFLASQWGGEKRIAATFKFFIYTFLGSLMMLIGIIYIYFHTRDHSFALSAFYEAHLLISTETQAWLFWFIFIAFAVKMPIFPFHTWQPDTYEQSPTAVTMVLSGLMVKMGVFGLLRWLAPVLPMGTYLWGDTVSMMCIIGMIYASLIAMRQDDLKRMVAYSSIAHIGLICLAVFATTELSIQGVMIQMFNHGINIIGLWIVVFLIEKQFNTRKISELGGLASKAPVLTAMLVIIALANIALPLTNAFIGEFLMFSGIYSSKATVYNVVFTVTAAMTIILSAVYMLNMVQRAFYGPTNALTEKGVDIRMNEKFVLGIIVALIIVVGVYPEPLFRLTQDSVNAVLSKMYVKP
ncbi:MAG TPA: NADH-quinone oxidoreductase subunit M [Puia sp.]|jgi:NADH-quinone oxidoreductase subunit M|nr:NADH-quinone oxidoreductase subunit M [Puia sp.]